jgi:hypothetical protein
MAWGPRFNHNISLFYPEAILNYFGIKPTDPNYEALLIRTRTIIEQEVSFTAKELNILVKSEFRKDLFDIEEYTTLGGYWLALESALSLPIHVGVMWGPKVVQAKFIDTSALGGLPELQEVQHEAYPAGRGNLGAWVSLYRRWLDGTDDRIGVTLQTRIAIMLSRGIAPFAELIETGNEQYPAYPHHAGKHTLEAFKPTYRRLMSIAYHRVLSLVEPMIVNTLPEKLEPTSIMVDEMPKSGFTWTSRTGKTVFLLSRSVKMVNNRLVGAGFMLSSQGNILQKWYGWLPR